MLDAASSIIGTMIALGAGSAWVIRLIDPSGILQHSSVILTSGALLLAAIGKYFIDRAKANKINAEADAIRAESERVRSMLHQAQDDSNDNQRVLINQKRRAK